MLPQPWDLCALEDSILLFHCRILGNTLALSEDKMICANVAPLYIRSPALVVDVRDHPGYRGLSGHLIVLPRLDLPHIRSQFHKGRVSLTGHILT